MDLKSLIEKMDLIEKKQILKESVDQQPSEQLTEAPLMEVEKVESIYDVLLEEFGYNSQVDEAEEFKFSPEQEKWLGGANRQDPYILARMPGPKPPVSYFKDPEDQAIAKKMNFGQSNLNTVKKALGMQPGDAQTFADPAPGQAAQPAQASGASDEKQHSADGNNPGAVATPVKEPGKVATRELPQAAQTSPVKEPSQITSRDLPPAGQAAQAGGTDKNKLPDTPPQVSMTPVAGQAAQPAKDAEGQGTIDPNKLKRFKELLAKAGAK